jgi:hypothetical protein
VAVTGPDDVEPDDRFDDAVPPLPGATCPAASPSAYPAAYPASYSVEVPGSAAAGSDVGSTVAAVSGAVVPASGEAGESATAAGGEVVAGVAGSEVVVGAAAVVAVSAVRDETPPAVSVVVVGSLTGAVSGMALAVGSSASNGAVGGTVHVEEAGSVAEQVPVGANVAGTAGTTEPEATQTAAATPLTTANLTTIGTPLRASGWSDTSGLTLLPAALGRQTEEGGP